MSESIVEQLWDVSQRDDMVIEVAGWLQRAADEIVQLRTWQADACEELVQYGRYVLDLTPVRRLLAEANYDKLPDWMEEPTS